MTFTEAAVEVLRRAGKPLHFKEIAEAALKENLLSHVGQDPEVTMGMRLAAMAKREEDRKVVAVAPDGTFALLEWNVPQEAQVEPVAPPTEPAAAGEPTYRPKEREPRPIHAPARRSGPQACLHRRRRAGDAGRVPAAFRAAGAGRGGPRAALGRAADERHAAGSRGAPRRGARAAAAAGRAGNRYLRKPLRRAA